MTTGIRCRKFILLAAATFVVVSAAFSQDQVGRVVHAFTERINDSISVDVKLRFDQSGLPEYYFCHVNTPVCEEGLCKLMVIDVFWDVLGNFLKYELPPNEPLTKFDHLPFSDEDHAKLRKILADRASILRDYPVEQLVDNTLVRKSDVVDAVTAATRVEVREAIVSGAVYSTYVLWHIVNGPIAYKIEEHSKPLISDALIMEMFQSRNLHYQYYALNHYPEKDSLLYLPEVINLVKDGVAYVPYFAVEKVPAWAWDDNLYQMDLIQHFPYADFQLQNAFLDKLSDVEVSASALDILARAMENITDKQKVKVLEIGERNKKRLSAGALEKIARFREHDDHQVSTLASRLVNRGKARN